MKVVLRYNDLKETLSKVSNNKVLYGREGIAKSL
jgi:hypothetical protein